jgi:hypothetical protein
MFRRTFADTGRPDKKRLGGVLPRRLVNQALSGTRDRCLRTDLKSHQYRAIQAKAIHPNEILTRMAQI